MSMQQINLQHENTHFSFVPVRNPSTLQVNDTLFYIDKDKYRVAVIQRIIKKMGGYRFQVGSDYGKLTYGVIGSCAIVGKATSSWAKE